MLLTGLKHAVSTYGGQKLLSAVAVAGGSFLSRGMAMWSVEKEKGHTYKRPEEIVNHGLIEQLLEETKNDAKDANCIKDILAHAKDQAFLTNYTPGPSEYVRSLELKQCATLLNVDVEDREMMDMIYDTAFLIKNRIYGNRIVLFAPLYLANYCVNNCVYCAFRAPNKDIERSLLTDDDIRSEVQALEQQGHRRLLVLTGEHPRYTFDMFLNALQVISDVKTEPCGNIRRMNVEIPALSVSDMKRLKATDKVGTYTLFQETYHRPTFSKMHLSGPKSNYDHRLLTMDRAFRGGLDDVGIGTLFGLCDYRFEVMAMLMHANHLEQEYKAGPHTISVPRLRAAQGSDVASNPPHAVDDADFKKLVAIIRIAVPYTGMILSTRESVEMRDELLKVGMSQMSAGSRTDVGAYHRENSKATEENLGELCGQFSLLDHRTTRDVVYDLLKKNYVPSWCTACYRKGRTGEHFMKIAKKGDIHNFCHPNSLLTLEEFINDYADPELKALGEEVVKKESEVDLSQGAKRMLDRKMKRVKEGEHDVYI